MKRVESDDALILRIYEVEGRPRTRGELAFSFPPERCSICNLLEMDERPLKLQGCRVAFTARSHEIITVKVQLNRSFQ